MNHYPMKKVFILYMFVIIAFSNTGQVRAEQQYKPMSATVTVNVTLSCTMQNTAYTTVFLQNKSIADTVYSRVMDATGTVFFPAVFQGYYKLTVSKFGYITYVDTSMLIEGNITLDLILIQVKTPPSNLQINNRSLKATWNPARFSVSVFSENWASGDLTTNGWTTSGGTNWQMSTGLGNPAPSVMFSWTPQVTNYDQYLTSKDLAGLHSPSLRLNYDIMLSNFGTTNENTMAVELWNGTTWTVLKTYTNLGGNIKWENENLDISQVTHDAFKIRFHSAGADSYDINNWEIDNISITASELANTNPCFLHYDFYLNNVLLSSPADTTYQIPSGQVVYGQTFTGCVAALYNNGSSMKICKPFVSHFLCPPTQLSATGIENAVYLTWDKPQCSAAELKCYVYDDGTMENGWSFSPGYVLWLGNKFPVPTGDNGTLISFQMMFMNNVDATNQYFRIDVFDIAGTLIGSSQNFYQPIPAPQGYFVVNLTNPIPYSGSFYAMVKWNNFTGATHWLGYDENGPYASQNLAYKYDGTTWSKISDPANGGNPGVFCLQACGIVAGDKKVISPEDIAPDNKESDAYLATGLMGYDLFRSQGGTTGPWMLIKHLVTYPDSLAWYDYNLDPGKWCYQVTAYYDLSAYGFAGQFDSSLPEGPQCVTLSYGRPLPFCEDWSEGSFWYNRWTFDVTGPGNWIFNTSVGNAAPCADFSGLPAKTNYNFSIESPNIDGTAWTCATLWLDFHYKLVDKNKTSNEKLDIEVYYSNSWHGKSEFMNNGNVDWTDVSYDISEVKGRTFRVRFRANGANSADMQHWFVDNICVYGICTPPTYLMASPIGKDVLLTWTPPVYKDIPSFWEWFIYDDSVWENRWSINPGTSGWIGNYFPVPPNVNGNIEMVKCYFINDPNHGSARLTIDFFDDSHTLLGSTNNFDVPQNGWDTVRVNNIPFSGPFYAMVHWNYTAAPTNRLGYDENGPYAAQDLGMFYDGTTWSKISDPINGGNPGVFAIRVLALAYHNKMLLGDQPDSSTMAGYNVYRASGVQWAGPFTKLNTTPLSLPAFRDTPPNPSERYRYFVMDVFENSVTHNKLCESSSDTIAINWPGYGINILDGGTIKVYPNPASDLVKIESTSKIKSIEVMNFIGQAVFTIKAVNDKKLQIDVSTLVAGVYFVRIFTVDGVLTTRIIVAK